MIFLCSSIPVNYPAWCNKPIDKNNQYLIEILETDENLSLFFQSIEEKIGDSLNNIYPNSNQIMDFDPQKHVNFKAFFLEDALEVFGFGEPIISFRKKRIKAETPLERLNNLFPNGLPLTSNLPGVNVNGRFCFELDINQVSDADLDILINIYKNSSLSLVMAISNQGLVLIPHDWTEYFD